MNNTTTPNSNLVMDSNDSVKYIQIVLFYHLGRKYLNLGICDPDESSYFCIQKLFRIH